MHLKAFQLTRNGFFGVHGTAPGSLKTAIQMRLRGMKAGQPLHTLFTVEAVSKVQMDF